MKIISNILILLPAWFMGSTTIGTQYFIISACIIINTILYVKKLSKLTDLLNARISVYYIVLILYCLIQIANWMCDFNPVGLYFEFNNNYKEWLPTTLYAADTKDGLIFLFTIWIYTLTLKSVLPSQSNHIVSTLTNIVYSGTFICVIGLIQHSIVDSKILFLFNSEFPTYYMHNFGPFVYAGNAICYLIPIICINLVLIKHEKTKNCQKLYITLIFMISSCLFSGSRIGMITGILFLFITFNFWQKSIKLKTFVYCLFFLTLIIAVNTFPNTFHKFTKVRFSKPISVKENEFSLKFKLSTNQNKDNTEKRLIRLSDKSGSNKFLDVRLKKDNLLISNHDGIRNRETTQTYKIKNLGQDSLHLSIENGKIKLTRRNSEVKIENTFGNGLPSETKFFDNLNIGPFNLFHLNSSVLRYVELEDTSNSGTRQFELDVNNFKSICKNYLSFTFRDRNVLWSYIPKLLKNWWTFGYGLHATSAAIYFDRNIGDSWASWLHCDPVDYFLQIGLVGGILTLPLVRQIIKFLQPLYHSNEFKVYFYGLYLLILFSFMDYPFHCMAVVLMMISCTILLKQIYLNDVESKDTANHFMRG